MRKHCWIYIHKMTGLIVLAQRPRRRMIDPRYSCLYQGFDGEVYCTSYSPDEMRKHYAYVGKV